MTASEISRSYGSGILTRRLFATWLDFAFIVGLIFAFTLIAKEQILGILSISLILAYYPVLESMYGQTCGKMLAGIIVVNNYGHLPRAIQSITRTLLRIFEVNPLLMGGIPAGIVVYFSRSKQRLGDMCASTYVILKSDREKITRRSL